MTTRAVIIRRAFGRIGLTDYVFNMTPDERADARLSLDAMMAEWVQQGVDLGYTPSDGTDNDAVEMTTPAYADAPIWDNLAIRLAPDFGKAITPKLSRDARRGYDLCATSEQIIPAQQAGRPSVRGGGDRFYRRFAY